jgi:hypothetical protein
MFMFIFWYIPQLNHNIDVSSRPTSDSLHRLLLSPYFRSRTHHEISRIHDRIPEKYSFAFSGFQDDHLWHDDSPSLLESKLLPDDFDLITRLPPTL